MKFRVEIFDPLLSLWPLFEGSEEQRSGFFNLANLRALSSRAERLFWGAQAASLRSFADVSGKLPETAGWQPALPGNFRGTRKDYDRNPLTISYPPKALSPVTSRPTASVWISWVPS